MKIEIKYVLRYLWSNKLITLVAAYCLIAVFLKSFSIIDITIPCLWTRIFGMRCPGCGLTTACIELTHFNISTAFRTNPLAFIIVPAVVYYVCRDYFKFRKKEIEISKDTSHI